MTSPNATVRRFVPVGLVGPCSVCGDAWRHGRDSKSSGPWRTGVRDAIGRDQFEVARRVEVARCGTRLPAKKLSPARLRAKVREAMTKTDGARRVAAGFAVTGGVARGADLFEQRLLGLNTG